MFPRWGSKTARRSQELERWASPAQPCRTRVRAGKWYSTALLNRKYLKFLLTEILVWTHHESRTEQAAGRKTQYLSHVLRATLQAWSPGLICPHTGPHAGRDQRHCLPSKPLKSPVLLGNSKQVLCSNACV